MRGEEFGHIGEASERDRAQTAAHDEALRAELRGLPTPEVEARHDGLNRAAWHEENAEGDYKRAKENVERASEGHVEAVARLEAARQLGRKERKRELPSAESRERSSRAGYERALRELREVQPPTHEARRREAVARQVLAEREERMMTAMRVSPSDYIVKELGERPTDPVKAKAWDNGVKGIEGYRQENGITDRQSALGLQPKTGAERARRESAERRLRDSQRRLGLERQRTQAREKARHIEGGGFGISM
jgi:hypothetical protein